MKEVKTIDDIKSAEKNLPIIIIFGDRNSNSTTEIISSYLEKMEQEKCFDLTYYFCNDIKLFNRVGFVKTPIIKIITKTSIDYFKNENASIDYDKLFEWIKNFIKE